MTQPRLDDPGGSRLRCGRVVAAAQNQITVKDQTIVQSRQLPRCSHEADNLPTGHPHPGRRTRTPPALPPITCGAGRGDNEASSRSEEPVLAARQRLRSGSGAVPGRFRVGSESVPGRFRGRRPVGQSGRPGQSARAEQPGPTSASRIGPSGPAEQDRPERASRAGQPEQDQPRPDRPGRISGNRAALPFAQHNRPDCPLSAQAPRKPFRRRNSDARPGAV